jgi:hypothetical protein
MVAPFLEEIVTDLSAGFGKSEHWSSETNSSKDTIQVACTSSGLLQPGAFAKISMVPFGLAK